MKKIEYYDKMNWGAVFFDLGVLALVGYTLNYWLLFLFLASSDWKIKKFEYEDA